MTVYKQSESIKERSQADAVSCFKSDREFDKLYPAEMQKLANRHWTPLDIAREAAEFLAPCKGTRVLDIGSGIGKFCLAAAQHRPESTFYGIELRNDLYELSQKVKAKLHLRNVSFKNANFTQLDMSRFDSFYFFNSFFENITTGKIDHNVEHSLSLFNYYNWHLFKQLDNKPVGTRIATFHSMENEMPPSYYIIKSDLEGQLKFWIKA